MARDEELKERLQTAKKIGLHPMTDKEIEEGEHYEVLAYTMSTDLHIPTIVEWENGEVDSLTDLEKSKQNRRESLNEAIT